MSSGGVNLNKEQRRIVYAPVGAILVKAAAGTGKTRVLTERIIHLINECNLNPEEVLAITFTNKAAEEMRERISEGIKNQYKMPDSISTIHSAFNRILRDNINLVDVRTSGYQIIDEEDQWAIIYKCIKQVRGKVPSHASDRRKLVDDFSRLKRGMEPKKIKYGDKYEEAWQRYERIIRDENKVDFDDILVLSRKLLYEYEEIRNVWRKKYKTIFVDEIQDLDALKWELVSSLCDAENTNFLAIGDPNQSIYLYDGAMVNIFSEIKEFFREIAEYTLNTNYRSARKIIEISNQVKNENYGDIQAASPKQGDIDTTPSSSAIIQKIIASEDLNKWAIIYYTNSEGEKIAKFLIERLIPLKINNFQLFKKNMVKKIILILKVIYFDNFQPLKDLIWSSLLEFKSHRKRKIIGMVNEGEYSGMSPKENFLSGIDWQNIDGLSQIEQIKIEELVFFINELTEMDREDIAPIIDRCIEYLKQPLNVDQVWVQMELENATIFKKWIELMQNKNPSFKGAQQILMNLQRYAEGDHQIYDSCITLSTIHSAKGLEWSKVLVLNYKGLKSFFEKKHENRNLAYVAITRAKETLVLEEEFSA